MSISFEYTPSALKRTACIMYARILMRHYVWIKMRDCQKNSAYLAISSPIRASVMSPLPIDTFKY